jgi:hypothetical protein
MLDILDGKVLQGRHAFFAYLLQVIFFKKNRDFL